MILGERETERERETAVATLMFPRTNHLIVLKADPIEHEHNYYLMLIIRMRVFNYCTNYRTMDVQGASSCSASDCIRALCFCPTPSKPHEEPYIKYSSVSHLTALRTLPDPSTTVCYRTLLTFTTL